MKKLIPTRCLAALARLAARLKSDQDGNIFMIMGFALIPLTFIAGFSVDYSRAMSLQTQLNAAADAAALAAVAPAMILRTDAESKTAAEKMFNAQAARLTGLQNLNLTVTINASTSGGSSGALGYLRKATVTYTVQSVNQFSRILGSQALTVGGTSAASAQQPPNVDFYLAMDNSPSMLLPSTSDGVTKIINATKLTDHPNKSLPNGCAFACHMMMPHDNGDPIFIRDQQVRDILLSVDYYTAGASKENVWYRYKWKSPVELFNSAGNSMNTSTSVVGPTTTTGSGNSRTEKFTTTVTATKYTITDSSSGPVTINKVVTETPTTTTQTYDNKGKPKTPTTQQGTVKTTTTTHDTGYWADGYWLTNNYGQIYGSPSKLTLRKDAMVSAASQLIPFAAEQANQYNVTYQAQMFSFDWTRPGNSHPVKQLNSLTSVASYSSGFSAASIFPADDRWWLNGKPTKTTNLDDIASEFTPMLTRMKNLIPNAGTGAPGQTPQKILFIISDGMLDQPNGSGRYFGPLRTSDLAECTAIKAKGIKIAILYTQYLPESIVGNPWSQNNIAPFLPAPPAPYSSSKAGSSDQILTQLQSCASPGTNGAPLVQTVTSDDDITTALQQLFSTALQTARLVQ